MGLDCSHEAWHGAYSAFHRWREKIAEVAGLPPIELMEGFYQPLEGKMTYSITPTLWHGGQQGLWKLEHLDTRLPIQWDSLKPDPLHELLYHSDCDGEIASDKCAAIADSLEKVIPLLPDGDGAGHIGNWKDTTQKFVDGLRLAASLGENLLFH